MLAILVKQTHTRRSSSGLTHHKDVLRQVRLHILEPTMSALIVRNGLLAVRQRVSVHLAKLYLRYSPTSIRFF